MVLAPIAAVITFMLGLRVGAGDAVTAASVFAAPPGNPPTMGAPVPFAWQVLTYIQDRGVRETIAESDLTVIARSKGKESRWTGSSNADGIAEAVLAIPGLLPGDAVELGVGVQDGVGGRVRDLDAGFDPQVGDQRTIGLEPAAPGRRGVVDVELGQGFGEAPDPAPGRESEVAVHREAVHERTRVAFCERAERAERRGRGL